MADFFDALSDELDEPFGLAQAIAFGLIWVALAIYTWSMFANRKH